MIFWVFALAWIGGFWMCSWYQSKKCIEIVVFISESEDEGRQASYWIGTAERLSKPNKEVE